MDKQAKKDRDARLDKYRHENRRNPTKAEIVFESMLKPICQKFRCQYMTQRAFQRVGRPDSFYLVDFYVKFPVRAVFEIDGSSHDHREDYDYRRDMDMMNAGVLVIRITNDQVINQKEYVQSVIEETIKSRLAHAAFERERPSSKKRTDRRNRSNTSRRSDTSRKQR